MRTATITDAKNRLSALIDVVKGGETVVITDRGRAVARIEPVVAVPDPTGRLDRLQRAGLVRIGTGAPPVELLGTTPPALRAGASAVDALIDERRAGR